MNDHINIALLQKKGPEKKHRKFSYLMKLASKKRESN